MNTRTCRKCLEAKPCTTKFFGHNPQGGFRHVCRTCMAANNRRLHAANPEQTQRRRESYKQRLETAAGFHTDNDILQIRKRHKDTCFYCGDALQGGGEKDHVVPLSSGGSNWAKNITLACRSCNRDKYDKSVPEFAQWRQRLGLKVSELCLDYLQSLKSGREK